jgi:hypothetical protein
MFGMKEASEAVTAEAAHDETKPEFPQKGASGNGTEQWYSVQARFMYSEARQFGGQIFDQRWKNVHFDQVAPPMGIPAGPPDLGGVRDRHGLYGYQAAQALRWWFHANAAASWQDGCLETRLVRHKVRYEYAIVAESAHAVIGSDDRSGLMPDWGAKA